MADDKEKNRRTKKRSRKHDPKRDVNEEYEVTDQEIAEELINDDIEQNESAEEEMNVNNLFTPSEVEEELADELVADDIEEDDDLNEGDLGLPESDNEDVFPGEDDDETAEEFAEFDVDEESEEKLKEKLRD